MNTTGCPPGLATDAAFDLPDASCDARMDVFWGLVGATLALKLGTMGMLLSTRHRQLRAERAAEEQRAQQARAEDRPPPKPAAKGPWWRHTSRLLIESYMFLVYATVFLTIGFNVANYYNAGAWAIFTIGFLGNATSKSLSMYAMVRLSRKILPAQLRNSQFAELIDKLDTAGMVMFAIMVLSTFVSQIMLVIVAPLVVGLETPLAQAGLAFKGFFTVSYQLAQIWQLLRCITVIKKHDEHLKKEPMALSEEALSRAREQMRVALRRLWKGCIVNLVFLPASLYYFVLAARVAPWKWWVVAIMGWFEVAATLVDSLFAGGRQSAWVALAAALARWRGRRPPASSLSAPAGKSLPHTLSEPGSKHRWADMVPGLPSLPSLPSMPRLPSFQGAPPPAAAAAAAAVSDADPGPERRA